MLDSNSVRQWSPTRWMGIEGASTFLNFVKMRCTITCLVPGLCLEDLRNKFIVMWVDKTILVSILSVAHVLSMDLIDYV